MQLFLHFLTFDFKKQVEITKDQSTSSLGVFLDKP